MIAEYFSPDGALVHRGELLLHLQEGQAVFIGGERYFIASVSTEPRAEGGIVRRVVVEAA